MVYLILEPDTGRILHISSTLEYQSNGNYLVKNNTVAIPPSIAILKEVETVPDNVEPEKWCYVDDEFVKNPNWHEPEGEEVDVDRVLAILGGEIE